MDKPSQQIERPHPKQQLLITCPANEIFFGGSRGGGKTKGFMLDWLSHLTQYGGDANGLFTRATEREFESLLDRAQNFFCQHGAKFNKTGRQFEWPNGALLRFRYLRTINDAERYQGHEYTRLYFEELGNMARPEPYFKMFATCRNTKGIPGRILANANPGGAGHWWLKKRFIQPAPPLTFIKETMPEGEWKRIYIPSRLKDNPSLDAESYAVALRQTGAEWLVRAWLDGDWDAVEGAYFSEFTPAKHVVMPHDIPAHWMRFLAMDWGVKSPFAVSWFAVADGTNHYPKGALINYREWYGGDSEGHGLGLSINEVAAGIKRRNGDEDIKYQIADPAIFANNGGPSIAEQFAQNGVIFMRGDNARVPGWTRMRQMLQTETPLLYFFDTCPAAIDYMNSVTGDERNQEDADTTGNDHQGDALRYGVMSRPWVAPKPPMPEKILKSVESLTLKDLRRIDIDYD